MRALKLVQHMRTNGERIAESLGRKLAASDKCTELVSKVSTDERRRYSLQIYGDLMDWLGAESDSIIEERYVTLGARRAQQGVPFSDLFWTVVIAREHLWEYIQQECLLEEPVEFWGGVMLLRSLNQFFDRALYFALEGYEDATRGAAAGVPAA